MEKLIEPLQQWVLENKEKRGVLVITMDEKKSDGLLTGYSFNIAQAVAEQVANSFEFRKLLIMGLLAATKNNRFLSLRARLIAWLLK